MQNRIQLLLIGENSNLNPYPVNSGITRQSRDGFRRVSTGTGFLAMSSSNQWRTLEMSIFEGEDPMGWLTKIKKYFRLEEDKLEPMMVAMDEEALGWFQWWESWNPNHSWEGFKIAISQRFQASNLGNPFQALLALEQEKAVQEFIDQFEKHVGMVKGLEEPFLVKVFLKGLKEEINTEVRLYEPKNLMESWSRLVR
ncbi:hypothetical protein HKD37_03G006579 [Glycine soja]